MKKIVNLLIFSLMGIFLMSGVLKDKETYAQKYKSGNITAAEFKAQLGLIAWLDDFDFDAKCFINSYTLYYTPKRQDPVTLHAKGGPFKGKINQVIKQAKSGDQYAFVNVKVKCPGDEVARKANSLYFKIK